MQDFVHQQYDKVGVPKDVGLGGLGVQKRLRSNEFPSSQSRQTQHNPPNEDQHTKTLNPKLEQQKLKSQKSPCPKNPKT